MCAYLIRMTALRRIIVRVFPSFNPFIIFTSFCCSCCPFHCWIRSWPSWLLCWPRWFLSWPRWFFCWPRWFLSWPGWLLSWPRWFFGWPRWFLCWPGWLFCWFLYGWLIIRFITRLLIVTRLFV